jgi:hypothetical protein
MKSSKKPWPLKTIYGSKEWINTTRIFCGTRHAVAYGAGKAAFGVSASRMKRQVGRRVIRQCAETGPTDELRPSHQHSVIGRARFQTLLSLKCPQVQAASDAVQALKD